MKAGLFILLLLWLPLMVLGNSAYPFDVTDPPRFLSELWFAENGHLMAEFAAYHLPVGDSVRIFLVHHFNNPYDYWWLEIPDDAQVLDIAVPTYENPQVVDVSALLPEVAFNTEEDSLSFVLAPYPVSEYNYSHWNHSIRWSNNIEYYNKYLKPLLPGQSYVWLDYYTWVKDEPPTPGTHVYSPVARSVVKLNITDQDNHPVPYVNHYDYHTDTYIGTDLNGEFNDVIYSGRYYLYIRHPITNALVCNQLYWVEPYDTLFISIQIEMPAEYPYTEYRGLQAYPSPFNSKDHNGIRFRYYGTLDTKSLSYIKIYDAKGRFIARESMALKGFSSWHPSHDIASGIYLARMTSGNRIVDTITFTIIK